MDNSFCVYKHTSPSGKVYVGITGQSPTRRWRDGDGYANNRHFMHAIHKYGWDNIAHEILHCGLSETEAKRIEVELISQHKSTDRAYGYNMTFGGECASPTDEAREHMSNAKKEWLKDPSNKTLFLERMNKDKSFYHSEQYRIKRREVSRRMWNSLEFREAYFKSRVAYSNKIMSEGPIRDAYLNAHGVKKVMCIETGVVYDSCSDAARNNQSITKGKVDTLANNIRVCCRENKWSTFGLHWEFVEN